MPPRSCWPAPTWNGIASSPTRPTSAPRVRRLPAVSVDRLGAPDRAEFLIALGGSLFLEDDFGAAAEVFESAMEIAPAAGDEARESVLDWYGAAMERWAAPYVTSRRAQMLTRLVARMEREQAKNPGSRAAAYWLAAGAARLGRHRPRLAGGHRGLGAGAAGRRRRGAAARRHRPAGARGHHSRPRPRSPRWRTRKPRGRAARGVGAGQAEVEVRARD